MRVLILLAALALAAPAAWAATPCTGASMTFDATPLSGSAAATHEMIHVFAPNANRFLAEGLAVYGHEFLKGVVSYPTFGFDLHRAARGYAERVDLGTLDELAVPRRLQTDDFVEKEAYIIAGSFVRFLVETHGMAKFRELYAMTPLEPYGRFSGDPDRWRAVYGKDLGALAADWRRTVTR